MNQQSAVIERVLMRRDADGVAWLTMNRPTARNALSMDLMQAMVTELDAIATDTEVKVVVIGGAGPAFCAGHDLRELRSRPEDVVIQIAQSHTLGGKHGSNEFQIAHLLIDSKRFYACSS